MSRRRERRARRSGLLGPTLRWVRRIQRLALIASIVAGVYRWWQSGPGRPGPGGGGSGRRAPIGGPQSPSASRTAAMPDPDLELVGTGGTSTSKLATPAAGGVPAAKAENGVWIEPLDSGSCPASHPVKANDSSGIYHVPGGRFYDRTVAARCYASADLAAADGFRPAKA